MFRTRLTVLTAVLALAAIPAIARADDWDDDDQGYPREGSSWRVNGEVSVDLAGATPAVTPEAFRTSLGAYGDWYASPRYGDVWRPRVAIGWRPYYYGEWLWTDEGWYWDSSEPFAWAVYHYGRWLYDPSWGWVWVPGYEWAPAWVTWRFADDVVGWSPLAPGVSVFVTSYPFVDFWWTFVPTVRFVGVPVYTVAYAPRETRHWYGATRPAPPRTAPSVRDGRGAPSPAWGGPPRPLIETRIGRAIVPERRLPAAGPVGRTEHERGRPMTAPPRGERERPTFAPPRGEPERPTFAPPQRMAPPDRRD
ncbi:MAG TPA: DUF6600 domain-containing protein, partial [Anaeromyxobacteraceae bacterium]|nr:DUF6600 domain-containing protein [Anaeromyxobacteraceae bacterium]